MQKKTRAKKVTRVKSHNQNVQFANANQDIFSDIDLLT